MTAQVIGITGRIATGKTTLAHQLQRDFNANYLSIDDMRRAAGGSDPDNFEAAWLSVREQVLEQTKTAIQSTNGMVVIEWARLIEDGFLDFTDTVLVTDCDDDMCFDRLKGGDLSREQIQARLDNQMKIAEIAKTLTERSKPYCIIDTRNDPSKMELNYA